MSGSLGSVMASGAGQFLQGAKKAWRAVGMIGAGGLAGGVGSAVSGGNFWKGVRNGLISSTLNHVAHMAQQNIRNLIAKIAEKYEGSKAWAYSVEKDNFDVETNKCNKFVYDVLTEAGASPGLPNGHPLMKFFGLGSPPLAGQWANPNYEIPGWEIVDNPQRGDVAAYAHSYSDATGHVAIMVSPTTSIGANATIVRTTNFGYGINHLPQGSRYVYRRYVGH